MTADDGGAAGRTACGTLLKLTTHYREEGGRLLSALVWDAGPGWRMVASGVLGGGIGDRSYVVNAQVDGDYRRTDPARHLSEIAAAAGESGRGVGMLTAADVERARFAVDGGVEAVATVGLGRPTWAAAEPELDEARIGASPPVQRPGTINIIVAVPAPLSDAALVNAATTATEAKVQALLEAGYPCTGTASDAVCVAALASDTCTAPIEAFGGPRSRWGARTARAVRAAVHQGAVEDAQRRAARH